VYSLCRVTRVSSQSPDPSLLSWSKRRNKQTKIKKPQNKFKQNNLGNWSEYCFFYNNYADFCGLVPTTQNLPWFWFTLTIKSPMILELSDKGSPIILVPQDKKNLQWILVMLTKNLNDFDTTAKNQGLFTLYFSWEAFLRGCAKSWAYFVQGYATRLLSDIFVNYSRRKPPLCQRLTENEIQLLSVQTNVLSVHLQSVGDVF